MRTRHLFQKPEGREQILGVVQEGRVGFNIESVQSKSEGGHGLWVASVVAAPDGLKDAFGAANSVLK